MGNLDGKTAVWGSKTALRAPKLGPVAWGKPNNSQRRTLEDADYLDHSTSRPRQVRLGRRAREVPPRQAHLIRLVATTEGGPIRKSSRCNLKQANAHKSEMSTGQPPPLSLNRNTNILQYLSNYSTASILERAATKPYIQQIRTEILQHWTRNVSAAGIYVDLVPPQLWCLVVPPVQTSTRQDAHSPFQKYLPSCSLSGSSFMARLITIQQAVSRLPSSGGWGPCWGACREDPWGAPWGEEGNPPAGLP